MAKRKGAGRSKPVVDGPNLDVGDSRKRIRDYEDVADSDDDFHIQRDKVLLAEEPQAKRRRKWQEQEEFLQESDEEVLDEPEDDEDEDEDLEDNNTARYDGDAGAVGSDASDAEVEDEEEEGMGWGTSKADLYGADAIETEEQALEEEAEALRLQKKQLQQMSAADYGFDETEWQGDGSAAGAKDEDASAVVTEVLPQLQISEDMSSAERLKLLKSRYPEFEPLSKELLRLKEVHATLAQAVNGLNGAITTSHVPVAMTKFQAASAYLGALTMYFMLLTSPAWDGKDGAVALSATVLRDHPVMDSLLQCRDIWQRAEHLSAEKPSPVIEDGPQDDLSVNESPDVEMEGAVSAQRVRQPKKTRAQRHAEAAQAEAQARRAERLAKTEAGLADLDTLVSSSALRKPSKSRGAVSIAAVPDLGEEAALTAQEAAEKAKRKKSLRFYTSQIAQKANKRGASGRNAGGDEDVPHRERLKDRQIRLNAEAEKRGKRRVDEGGDLGGESDEEDHRQARQIRAEADEGDYYDLVASRTAKKKSEKAALAEAQRQAALQGGQVVEEEVVGPDGKRKISYAIEKNKGLTPHRKKDVRNPRVKKRKKYEEKKKKLASIKPVYKGGEGRGGYGGELTGIKKGLVKSTKL